MSCGSVRHARLVGVLSVSSGSVRQQQWPSQCDVQWAVCYRSVRLVTGTDDVQLQWSVRGWLHVQSRVHGAKPVELYRRVVLIQHHEYYGMSAVPGWPVRRVSGSQQRDVQRSV